MQTVSDMRGVGVKNRGKIADVLYGRPLAGPRRIILQPQGTPAVLTLETSQAHIYL